MTRTISLITVLGAALVLGVPAAWGQGKTSTPQWQQALTARSEALNQRYGLGDSSQAMKADEIRSEALNRKHGLGAYGSIKADEIRSEALNQRYGLGDSSQAMNADEIRSEALNRRYGLGDTVTAGQRLAFDNHKLEPTAGPPTVAATGSGNERDWPQIGVAFGIGVALMLGIFLMLRLVHARPLAH